MTTGVIERPPWAGMHVYYWDLEILQSSINTGIDFLDGDVDAVTAKMSDNCSALTPDSEELMPRVRPHLWLT